MTNCKIVNLFQKNIGSNIVKFNQIRPSFYAFYDLYEYKVLSKKTCETVNFYNMISESQMNLKCLYYIDFQDQANL